MEMKSVSFSMMNSIGFAFRELVLSSFADVFPVAHAVSDIFVMAAAHFEMRSHISFGSVSMNINRLPTATGPKFYAVRKCALFESRVRTISTASSGVAIA